MRVLSLCISDPGVPSRHCIWTAIESHSVADVCMHRVGARVVGVFHTELGRCWVRSSLL